MIGPRVRSAAERLYALVLSLYPEEFRAEYGPDMVEAFRDWRTGRARRGRGGLRFWADVLLEAARRKDLLPREGAA